MVGTMHNAFSGIYFLSFLPSGDAINHSIQAEVSTTLSSAAIKSGLCDRGSP